MIHSNSIKLWLLAARPKTLPAAVIPVLVGGSLAGRHDSFALLPFSLCLGFALLVQIATNYANDYLDFRKGADRPDRIGPTRAVAAGLISAEHMRRATFITLGLAFVVGMGLVPFGGWWLIVVGAASLICAVGYTADPIALGYRGLGDLFVILFFGLIAVQMTAYVQTGFFPGDGWLIGLGLGLVINNLLVVNNHRDRDSDARAGKLTLTVRLGARFSEIQYAGSIVIAGGVALTAGLSLTGLLLCTAGLLTGGRTAFQLTRARGASQYGRLLAMTALTVVLYGCGIAIGL